MPPISSAASLNNLRNASTSSAPGALEIRNESLTAAERLTLAWDDIWVRARPPPELTTLFKKRRYKLQLLKGVSGIAEPGTMTALMGCSGAGKSTLMNVLTQRNLRGLKVEGTVLLNGVPLQKISSVSKFIGYIQQHDILPRSLTVKEYLYFNAELLLSSEMTKAEKLQVVEDVILRLSLKSCANCQIGGELTFEKISGGERKRVSIAARLINNPRILILDEPTTGLDSYIGGLLMEILQDLAGKGYTIICTIHQPSSDIFIKFDRLILLANGRCAYTGARKEAVKYFASLGYPCPGSFSPADYLIQILINRPGYEIQSKKNIEYLCRAYDTSSRAKSTDYKIEAQYNRKTTKDLGVSMIMDQRRENRYEACWLSQFKMLIQRDVIGIVRCPERLLMQTFSALVSIFFLNACYFNPKGKYDQSTVNNTSGLLFCYINTFSLLNAVPLLITVTDNLALVAKEYRDGMYRPTAYYLSTLVTEVSFTLLLTVLQFFTTYYVTGLNSDTRQMGLTFAVIMLCVVVTTGYFFAQAMIWEKPLRAIEVAIPLIVMYCVLGGFFVDPRSSPEYLLPLFMINWLPWAFEIVTVLQWEDVTGIGCEYPIPSICVSNGEEVLYRLNFSHDNIKEDLIVLGCHVVLFHLLAIILLVWKVRRTLNG